MPIEPQVKRAVAFVDGQNLYHGAKAAFGYSWPNYDVLKLSERICAIQGWQLAEVRFYTGVPDSQDNRYWHAFWGNKLSMMGRQGIHVFSRPLRYRNKRVRLPDGTEHTFLDGDEKGIDIRIALDVIRLAHRKAYDVALVFSQDQDLSEAADDLRLIASEQNRWIKIASAFPDSPTCRNHRGINSTDWIKIDRPDYAACIDPRDYRPKQN